MKDNRVRSMVASGGNLARLEYSVSQCLCLSSFPLELGYMNRRAAGLKGRVAEGAQRDFCCLLKCHSAFELMCPKSLINV